MKKVQTTKEFYKWFSGLRDRNAKLKIQARIDRAEDGNYGDYKNVGEGVLEMRIFYGEGYRLYFIEREESLVIMLAGGTKSGQERDIKKAIEISKLF